MEQLVKPFYKPLPPFEYHSSTTHRRPYASVHIEMDDPLLQVCQSVRIRASCSAISCTGHMIDLICAEEFLRASHPDVSYAGMLHKEFGQSFQFWSKVRSARLDDLTFYRWDAHECSFVTPLFATKLLGKVWHKDCRTTILSVLDLLGTYLMEFPSVQYPTARYLDLWFPTALFARRRHGLGEIGMSYFVFPDFPIERSKVNAACTAICRRMSLALPDIIDLHLDAMENSHFSESQHYQLHNHIASEFSRANFISCNNVPVRFVSEIVCDFKKVICIRATVSYMHKLDRDHIATLVLGVAANRRLQTLNIEPSNILHDNSAIRRIGAFFSEFMIGRRAMATLVSADLDSYNRLLYLGHARLRKLKEQSKDSTPYLHFFSHPLLEQRVLGIVDQFIHGNSTLIHRAAQAIPEGFR